MNKADFVKEVTAYINENVEETDGDVDLMAAGDDLKSFCDDLEGDDEGDEETPA